MQRFFRILFPPQIIFPFLIIGIIADFIIYIVSYISALDAIQTSIGYLDFTDFAYSQVGLTDLITEKNIVLVNIGPVEVGRDQIGIMIQNLKEYQPAVVGVDAFFYSPKDPHKDSILMDALGKVNNLVMASRVHWSKTNHLDSVIYSNNMFTGNAISGYSNLLISNQPGLYEPRSIREYPTYGIFKDKKIYPFALEVLRLYDPEKLEAYLKKSKPREIINYQGNLNNYHTIEWRDAYHNNPKLAIVKNKIVLIGFMGNELNSPSYRDMFYTPLIRSKYEKNLPDMYGVVIHANIISMILNNDLKSKLNYQLNWILQILVYYLFLVFCYHIFSRNEDNYPLISIVSLFVLINILILSSIFIYKYLDLKFQVGLAIIYSIFIPDGLEIYKKNIERFINRIKIRKWIIIFILILLSILVEGIGVYLKSLNIGLFN